MSVSLLAELTAPLTDRAGGACELCGGSDDLQAVEVGPSDIPVVDRAMLQCAACRDSATDSPHWFCLQESVWSEVPAVQVASYRLLHGISGSWARDVLDTVYLDEATLDWAQRGLKDPDAPVVRDSNGKELADGDSVTLIKDLDVKGAGFTAKRGTMVKNIRLGDDPTHVEGRVNGTAIFLKTEFLKKA